MNKDYIYLKAVEKQTKQQIKLKLTNHLKAVNAKNVTHNLVFFRTNLLF